MTQEELSHEIVTSLMPEDYGTMADVLFDAIEGHYTPDEVAKISEVLLAAGVDVRPICRKKHPT